MHPRDPEQLPRATFLRDSYSRKFPPYLKACWGSSTQSYATSPPSLTHYSPKQRNKCWEIRAYPCTGLGLFFEPLTPQTFRLSHRNDTPHLWSKLFEIECFTGTDLRHLVAAVVPSKNIVAIDIVSVRYAMFSDLNKFEASFIEADLLNIDAKPELAAMKGTFDIIYVAQVLHQWGWNK
jgi:SAM-dependent methyltransferase